MISETMNQWREDAAALKEGGGDIALFWAGKMSQLSWVLTVCHIYNVSENINLLYLVHTEYDEEIYSRAIGSKAN